MCVNAVNRDAPRWIPQNQGGQLEGRANVPIRNVILPTFVEECGEERTRVGRVVPDMQIPTPERSDRARQTLAIMLLMDANTLPTILLVVQLESGRMHRHDEVAWCIPRQLS